MSMARIVALLLFATALLGQETWEGELRTSRWPTFVAVTVEGNRGSLKVLGRTYPLSEVRRDGAALRVVAGSGEGAAVVEGTVAGDRWSGTLTSGKDVLAFTFSRVPAYPAPKDRVEAWSQDLDAMQQRFLRYDRSFSAGERARFTEDLEALRKELPKLDDAQVIMRMASLVALARNAHTRLYLLRNRTELRRLPVRVWWFDDGLRIVRTTPEYRKLLGCRIDDFAGVAARHARDIVSAAYAANPSWNDYKSTYFLTSPEALHGFGITPSVDRVDIGVSGCGDAPFRASLDPLPLVKKSGATEAWWDLSPLSADPDHRWVHVLGRDALPLYLRNPEPYYWFEFLPESGILYFHYSRASDGPGESTKDFGARLLAELAAKPVKALVVDLRFNTGGDYGVARPLMEQLAESTKTIPRWVIAGRATFSAGISHVALWKGLPNVKLIGEPVGDELDFWSEGGNVVLPNSKFSAHFANGAHSYSEAPCPEETYCFDLNVPTVRPDVPVTLTWQEYRAGVDPAMRAIVRSLGK